MAKRLRFKLSASEEHIFPGELTPERETVSPSFPRCDEAETISDNQSTGQTSAIISSFPSYSLLEENVFIRAMISDEIIKLQRLLRDQAYVVNMSHAQDGTPALIVATAFNNLSAMRMLICAGYDVGVTAVSGQYRGLTPLHVSCLLGHANGFNLLVKNCADIRGTTVVNHISGTKGSTCLHFAVHRNNYYMCDRILKACDELKDCIDCEGLTPLHVACKLGYFSLVRLFLKMGGNPNAQDRNGLSPLMHAVQNRHALLPGILLKSSNLSLKADMDYGTGVSVIHLATVLGEARLLQDFLEMGGNPREPCQKMKIRLWKFKDGCLEPAHIAALHGHLDILAILDKFMKIRNVSSGNVTPLSLAVAADKIQTVSYLVSEGCDVNGTLSIDNKSRVTALHIAAEMGLGDMVEDLLSNKADPDLQTETKRGVKDYSPLHIACRRRHVTVVSHLLAGNANIRLQDAKGLTPLHIAAQVGHCEIIGMLLKFEQTLAYRQSVPVALQSCGSKFADSSYAAECEELQSPCIPEIWEDRSPEDTLELQNSAKLPSEMMDKEGRFPISIAANQNRTDVIQIFISYNNNVKVISTSGCGSMLHLVAANSNLFPVMCLLVTSGVDLHVQNQFGYTPLHTAAENNNQHAVKALLLGPLLPREHPQADELDDIFMASVEKLKSQCPVDVNKSNDDGYTALHLSARGNHKVVVEALLLAGADVNCSDENGVTPLHLASCMGNSVVEMLVQAGANPNAHCHWKIQNSRCNCVTPLLLAVQEKETKTCSVLIGAGANVNCACGSNDSSSMTALHLALAVRNCDIAQLLISNDCSVNTVNDNGQTPLVIAMDLELEGRLKVINSMLSRGADPNALSKLTYSQQYITPLEKALGHIIFSHQDITSCLLNAGADVNKRCADGRTVFHRTVKTFSGGYGVNKQAFEQLLNKSTQLNDSVRELASNDLGVLLQTAICDHSVCDENGDSPLATAVKAGHEDSVTLLLKYGSDPNFPAGNGETPLQMAVALKHYMVVRRLLKAGASIEGIHMWEVAIAAGDDHLLGILLDHAGSLDTPPSLICPESYGGVLHFAVLNSNEAGLERFIKGKVCPVDVTDSLGRTALYLAMMTNNVQIALLLLVSGASAAKAMLYRDANGMSLLHRLVSGSQKIFVSLLCLYSPDIDEKVEAYDGENDVTALHIAAMEGRKDNVDILLRAGSNIHCTTKNGKDAAMLALERDHEVLFQYLDQRKNINEETEN